MDRYKLGNVKLLYLTVVDSFSLHDQGFVPSISLVLSGNILILHVEKIALTLHNAFRFIIKEKLNRF